MLRQVTEMMNVRSVMNRIVTSPQPFGTRQRSRFGRSMAGVTGKLLHGGCMKSKLVLLGTAIFLLLATMLGSQGPTAGINGLVTDASGAAVPSANIVAKDLERGTTWPTETNSQGFYNLPRLPIGNYEIRVEAKGFQSAVQRSVTLVIDQVAKIDIQLQVGQVSQTLEVSSAAPILQTET